MSHRREASERCKVTPAGNGRADRGVRIQPVYTPYVWLAAMMFAIVAAFAFVVFCICW